MGTKTKAAPKQRINIALQGGGSHGAYTWGVLDALLQDDRIHVEGVSGTSAGGMNATAMIQGLIQNGRQGARDSLAAFWNRVGEEGLKSWIQLNPIDKMAKNFSVSKNPMFQMLKMMNSFYSPYQLNPRNEHPMRKVVEDVFDFNLLRKATDPKLFLCATHIATGKLKIFSNKEMSPEAVLASACVPTLFQAVEVDGEFYWDGGFIGNPAIYPLIYNCEAPDILVIQIRRVHDDKVPTTVQEIQNRLGEITQNACLTREMRAIAFITQLIDTGVIPKDKLKKLNMHLIRDDNFFGNLERESGFSADPDFLKYLFNAGQKAGQKWLKENGDAIGVRTTANIEKDYL